MARPSTSSRTKNARFSLTRPFLATVVAAVCLGTFGFGVAGARDATLTLTAASNGHLVIVNPGTRIIVSLSGSTWTFTTTGNQRAVTEVSTVVTKGASSGALHACVPGNCPAVTVHYVAFHPGQSRLQAYRASCGTGVACTASTSHWTVVIRVR